MAIVVFLGPEGSFTHQAALSRFHDDDLRPKDNVTAVFASMESKHADFGVVPFSNSRAGDVVATTECLASTRLTTPLTFDLKIEHHLYTKPNAKPPFAKIISHPQALAQCKDFLRENFPDTPQVEASSTSKAVQLMLADDEPAAAIAGPQMTQYYKLQCARSQIQDDEENTTTFVVLAHDSSPKRFEPC